MLPPGTYVPVFHGAQQPDTPDAGADPGLQMPAGPSIAVLPFDNMSADPDQEFFSDGVTEEIITRLCQIPELFVIGRNSTFVYKGKPTDVREVGRDLGVRFVLEGSVRRGGQTVRVTAQLLDASTGVHVWGESFDRELTPQNVLDVENAIAEQIAVRVGQPYGAIYRRDLPAALRMAESDMGAYEAVLQSYDYYARPGLERFREVDAAVEAALSRSPGTPTLWAARAYLLLDDWRLSFGVRPNAESLVDEGLDLAERAVAAEPYCGLAHQVLVAIHGARRDPVRLEASGERGLRAVPNYSDFLADYGFALAMSAGKWDRGLDLLAKACTLNPHYPGWYNAAFLIDAYNREDHEAAAGLADALSMPELFWGSVLRAIAYHSAGNEAEAAKAIEALRAQYPDFEKQARFEWMKWVGSDALIDRLLADLRALGLDIPV